MTISEKTPYARLVAVSNRTAAGQENKAGGLAVALWETLADTNGQWIGWSGRILDFPSNRAKTAFDDGVEFALTDYSRQQYDGFYLGYSNSVLWPVMHNRIDLAVFDADFFRYYSEINEKFANIVRRQASEDDLVWVHDYHFFLLGWLRATDLHHRQRVQLHLLILALPCRYFVKDLAIHTCNLFL